jgi:type I restriction enzyme R subunit
VLLVGLLREALRRVNPVGDGSPWLDEARVNRAVGDLRRAGGAAKLLEANQRAKELMADTVLEGDGVRSATASQP